MCAEVYGLVVSVATHDHKIVGSIPRLAVYSVPKQNILFYLAPGHSVVNRWTGISSGLGEDVGLPN